MPVSDIQLEAEETDGLEKDGIGEITAEENQQPMVEDK
jgi:hypothetical protein